jgi:hypothetical protein
MAYITQNGNQITIWIPIAFSGANQDAYDRMAMSIHNHWTGKFGKYCVTTNVLDGRYMSPSETNKVQVLPGGGSGNVDGLSQTDNYRSGLWYAQPSRSDDLDYAHEAGHLMGLDDLNDSPSLMNQYNTTTDISQREIQMTLASPTNVIWH